MKKRRNIKVGPTKQKFLYQLTTEDFRHEICNLRRKKCRNLSEGQIYFLNLRRNVNVVSSIP